jgi:hypothetical protein
MSRIRSSDDIASIVLRLTKKLGLDGARVFDAKAALEAMKRHFPDFNYQEVADAELPAAEGAYDSTSNTVLFPERVFKRLESRDPRVNFSVAHELAHYVLNHQNLRFRHTEKEAYERASPNVQREEREANQFAAFLLAPDALCEDCTTIFDFMLKFGLSQRAAEIRKEDYERYLRRLRGEPRPLTPTVVDLLEYLRSKGNNVSVLEQSVPKPPAVASRQLKKPVYEPIFDERRPRYMSGICVVCRNATVFPLDAKFKCDTCQTVSDQFQDGDIVDA